MQCKEGFENIKAEVDHITGNLGQKCQREHAVL